MNNKITDLKVKYDSEYSIYDSMCNEIIRQISYLLNENNITLAIPISYRIKEWSSITNKIQGKEFAYKELADVNDLAGIRIIALFQSDVIKIQKILRDNFELKREEDTTSRLSENQFGYGSIHFEVTLPENWVSIPSNLRFKSLITEIQLRTVAQHAWAAASHVLNYKKEKDVPLPVKRAINRVAALLETVDLEFERVLIDKSDYSKKPIGEKDALNVDLLIQVMEKLLPSENKDNEEEYSEILEELLFVNITTVESLELIIDKNLKEVLEEDRERVNENNQSNDNTIFHPEYGETTIERHNKGVFYTHSGLMRGILDIEFGFKNTIRGKFFPLVLQT